jgi:hypothetical protein
LTFLRKSQRICSQRIKKFTNFPVKKPRDKTHKHSRSPYELKAELTTRSNNKQNSEPSNEHKVISFIQLCSKKTRTKINKLQVELKLIASYKATCDSHIAPEKKTQTNWATLGYFSHELYFSHTKKHHRRRGKRQTNFLEKLRKRRSDEHENYYCWGSENNEL